MDKIDKWSCQYIYFDDDLEEEEEEEEKKLEEMTPFPARVTKKQWVIESKWGVGEVPARMDRTKDTRHGMRDTWDTWDTRI